MTVSWSHDWRGIELIERVQHATGRGLIGIGEQVAVNAKRHADVISGTMRRSIHTAEVNYVGAEDEGMAADGQDLGATYTGINATEVERDEGNPVLAVGSWVSYACVEEVGRGHRFMQPAIEEVRGAVAYGVMAQAFAEEGLL